MSLVDRISETLNFEMFSYDNLEVEHSELRNLLLEIKAKLKESEEV